MKIKRWIVFGLITFLIFDYLSIPRVKAAQSVIMTFNGVEQKEYTTINVGEILEVKAFLDNEVIHEITWSSDAEDIISISGDKEGALLEAKSIGMGTITVNITTENGEVQKNLIVYTRLEAENMVYAEEERQQETSVHSAFTLNTRAAGDITITFDGEERVSYTTIGIHDTKEVKAYVESEIIQNIQWTSNKPDVLSISGDKDGAVIEGKSIGVATITAKITTSNGTVSTDIMISTRTSLDMIGYANADTDMHRAANESSSISRNISKNDVFEIKGENGNYYWISYDDSSGFVRKSKVNIPAIGLTLNKEYIVLKKNEQETVSAEILPVLYTGNITWTSNKTDVAAINNNGKVTGKKEGAAKVHATAEGVNGDIRTSCNVSIWTEFKEVAAVTSRAVNGKKGALSDADHTGIVAKGRSVKLIGQCGDFYYVKLADNSKVFIEKSAIIVPAVSITLNAVNITLGTGKTHQLTAKILPDLATDKKVLWSSSNSNIAKVNANGKVTGMKQGSAYVRARNSEGKLVAECKVDVKGNQDLDSPLIKSIKVSSVTVADCQSAEFNVRINANFDKNVTYEIIMYNQNKKKAWSYLQNTMRTNTDQGFMLMDLEYNKKYYMRIIVTYKENGKKKTKKSGMIGIKTKKPKVELSVIKAGQSSQQLKMETNPEKLYGTTCKVRYKLKGSKTYTALGKKDYTKKGSNIQIKKSLLPGKTYTFETALYDQGKLVCKDTVDVKAGYTTVKVNTNSSLSEINVKWGKIAFADGYEIYRSEQKGKLGKKIKTVKKPDTTNYTDATKNLENGKKYYYQVLPYWTEKKNKKTGSSNQASILCKKIDIAVNKKVLLNDKKLKNLIDNSNNKNINNYYLTQTNASNGKIENYYPAIKYQFNGKTLTIHLYIEYSSYRFSNQFHADGTPVCIEEPMSAVKNKVRKNGKKYVNQFQKGLKKYFHNQLVKGTKENFGSKVNFKTALVIHRKDNNKENYHRDQQFIEVMVGGINKYSYNKDMYHKDSNPYWYHALTLDQKIYIPEDGQLKLNAGKDYQTPVSDYLAASAHEMGHVLGLGDAYYDDTTGMERHTENKETCIYENGVHYNMMQSSNKGFTANDFEMMLRAYQEDGNGKVVTQYYKSHDKFIISDAIKTQTAR